MTEVRDGIAISRDRGSLAAGRGPLIQVRVAGGRAVPQVVTALPAREIPVLATFAEPWPAGRDQVIGEVAAELAATLSVQLYGAAGAGKKAIARAVIRRLASGPNPVRGVALWPEGPQPRTLESLYERLTALFFAGTTFQPPESRLRVAAAAAGLAAVVVIGDCELPARDLARLLGTFPDCTFLLTSGHRTLFSSGVAHEVGPLAPDAAAGLIAAQAGQRPAPGQVAQARDLAAGQTWRLLQSAAFLRGAPGPAGLPAPAEQAAVLAAGLAAPAAAGLAALATFGTALTPDCLAAVTGRPAGPGTGPDVAEAGAELEAAGLVSRAGAAHGGMAYRITPDALAAVAALGWAPASAVTAGHGLLQRLSGPEPGHPPPSPALLLAVAARLQAGGADRQAARLIGAGLPDVLRAGYVTDWLALLRLGLETARAAGDAGDLAYFTGEDDTRQRMSGEKPAAAAVTGAAGGGTAGGATAGTMGAPGPPTAVAAGPLAGTRSGAGGPPGPRRPGPGGILLAGHGIPLIVVVVVLAIAGVLLVRSRAEPRTPGAGAAAGASHAAAAPGASSPAASSPGTRPPARRTRPLASPSRPAPVHARPAPTPRPGPGHRASHSASPSPSPPPTTPASVVRAFVAAINARDYQRAWLLGGDHLTPSYDQFVAGFASTASDTVTVGPTSGSIVGVLLTAVQTDGTTKFYSGTYTVTGGVITGSNIQQTG
jgi:hypothetical protein